MRNFTIYILLGSMCSALAVITGPATATEEQLFRENIRFHHLSTRDGLSQNTISAIYQDRYGYMWFGSDDGLNRYNGYDFTVFRSHRDDSLSLSYNNITDILEDSDGTLWIGTSGGGFNRFCRDTETFTRYTTDAEDPARGLTENTAASLVEDTEGYIWIGTGNGLNRFDPESETFDHYYSDSANPNSLSDNRITDLLVDRDGYLWVGTRNGLNRKKPGNSHFRRYYHDPDDSGSIRHDHIWALLEDRDGVIWIGTAGGGLNYLDPESSTFKSYTYDRNNPHSISDNSVYSLHEDHRGVLWAGGENNGLNAYDRENERFYRYQHDVQNPYSLSFNAVYSIYESNNGILWVGTFAGALNLFDLNPPRFEFYRHDPYHPNPLSNNNILSFKEDHEGYIWIGTDGGGLNKLEISSSSFSTFRHDPDDPNTIPSDVILNIDIDNEGYIWTGSYNGGLSRFNPENMQFTHYKRDPDDPGSLNSNHIYRIHFEKDEVWAGTHGGGINVLNRQTGKFRRYHQSGDGDQTMLNDFINDIYRDRDGTIWVATHGGGIARYDRESGQFTHYASFNNMLSSFAAIAIHEDRYGRFWVGTDNGLNLFDRENETYILYDEDDGLANHFIRGILEDDDGNLWLSTNSGISKFYPDTENFENYQATSGYPGNEFNSRSYYRDSNGYMYFGGPEGFNRFHPDNIALNDYVAPIVFTDFLIYNQPVPIGEDSPLQRHISQTEQLTLSYQHSVLTFEFATLNFDIHKNDSFSYFLEGFDQTWNHIDDRRSATYTNLSPGEYRLRVRAFNSDGIMGRQEATIAIIITPPFWQTTWFYILATLGFIGLAFGFYRRKMYTISQRNKELQDEVKTRTAELQESNAALKETLEELQSTRDQLVEKAHKAGMADLATSVLHDVGNILNSVNVSTAVIRDTIENSWLKKLHDANRLLQENLETVEDFILHDSRGKTLLEYFAKLDKPLREEHQKLKTHNERLTEKINLIIDVVAAQQNFSTAGRISEEFQLEQIVEETLIISDNSITHNDITITKKFEPTDPVLIEKTKLIHVLINLLKNAVQSIDIRKPDNREIVIRIYQINGEVRLSIFDTGTGFDQKMKSRLFTHGFTTKKGGHGYGLHSCANYMREMKGSIDAQSDGPGKGATFTLTLPGKNNRGES